jgi:hypothetical protein
MPSLCMSGKWKVEVLRSTNEAMKLTQNVVHLTFGDDTAMIQVVCGARK